MNTKENIVSLNPFTRFIHFICVLLLTAIIASIIQNNDAKQV
jgi:uncharacterized membrane protein (DUF106 family)